jgi:hypothetical protein
MKLQMFSIGNIRISLALVLQADNDFHIVRKPFLSMLIMIMFDPQQRQRIFLLASVSRPALRPTQPPVQWVPGVLSRGLKHGQGMTLTSHPRLVLFTDP